MKVENRRTVYIPDDVLLEMMEECRRRERSLSWLIRLAWFTSREYIVESDPGTLVDGPSE